MIRFIARYTTVDNIHSINLVEINENSYGLEHYQDGKYIYTAYFPDKNLKEVKNIASKFLINCSQTKVNDEFRNNNFQ